MLRRAGVDFPSLAVREVTIMRTGVSVLVLVLVMGIRIPVASTQGAAAPKAPNTPRLYIFDCGLINVNRAGTERYRVTLEEVGATRQQRRQR